MASFHFVLDPYGYRVYASWTMQRVGYVEVQDSAIGFNRNYYSVVLTANRIDHHYAAKETSIMQKWVHRCLIGIPSEPSSGSPSDSGSYGCPARQTP